MTFIVGVSAQYRCVRRCGWLRNVLKCSSADLKPPCDAGKIRRSARGFSHTINLKRLEFCVPRTLPNGWQRIPTGVFEVLAPGWSPVSVPGHAFGRAVATSGPWSGYLIRTQTSSATPSSHASSLIVDVGFYQTSWSSIRMGTLLWWRSRLAGCWPCLQTLESRGGSMLLLLLPSLWGGSS